MQVLLRSMSPNIATSVPFLYVFIFFLILQIVENYHTDLLVIGSQSIDTQRSWTNIDNDLKIKMIRAS